MTGGGSIVMLSIEGQTKLYKTETKMCKLKETKGKETVKREE